MKCAATGCTQEAHRQCSECARNFCNKHVEICGWCQAFVCYDCRDEHDANNPLHEEGTPNA